MDSKNTSQSYDDLPVYTRDPREQLPNSSPTSGERAQYYQSDNYAERSDPGMARRYPSSGDGIQETRREEYSPRDNYNTREPVYATNSIPSNRPQYYQTNDYVKRNEPTMGRREFASNPASRQNCGTQNYQGNDYYNHETSAMGRRDVSSFGGMRGAQRDFTRSGDFDNYDGDRGNGGRRFGGGIIGRRRERRAAGGRVGILGLVGNVMGSVTRK